ncbi:putative sporulation protein YtxC [Desulfofalx alkaliphila]|uniref:putative sporulation protein YtxC n=1 Tax=Desulfofalx alkaliphila TaxID=105483 RepID=UPI0009FEF705|nr:putative sporulation protein YtxC [Desulfofalx alkaliphila]
MYCNNGRGDYVNPCISIGASKHVDLLKANLRRQFCILEDEGIKVEVSELPAGKYTFLSCNLGNKCCPPSNGEKEYKLFQNYVASVVSDVILNKWESVLLNDLIRENYYYFNEEEKQRIFQHTVEKLRMKNGEMGYRVHNQRRNQIYQRLNEYLSNHDHLVVDGFIRFRLKEYISELKDAIDNAVDDFLIEREYGEFIQLLRYFVEIQEPRIDQVHIIVKDNGYFGLYDKNKKRLNHEEIDDFVLNMIESDINYEDLLLSALISIAPREIVFHYKEKSYPKNTLKMVQDVFVGRVQLCNSCDWCEKET